MKVIRDLLGAGTLRIQRMAKLLELSLASFAHLLVSSFTISSFHNAQYLHISCASSSLASK